MQPSNLGYSSQGSFNPVGPTKTNNPASCYFYKNSGFDLGQQLVKDQQTSDKGVIASSTNVPKLSCITTSNSCGLTYSYGQSRSNYLSGVSNGQRSYSFSKKSPNSQQKRQFFLPLKGKIQLLSRESNPTFTDLDAEINDLASIVRREREQSTISRRSSSLATIPGKSTPNGFSPNHQKQSECTINLAHSLGQSITDGLEDSPNSSCILTKTSSLQARYVGSQILGAPTFEQTTEAENLGRQVILLKNEVNSLLSKQNQSNELSKRVREENDVLCVKLLNAEKTIASNKTLIDELQMQLFQARTAVQGSSQLLQNVAVLEGRLKMDSNQNIELSQALLRQESKYAMCEATLQEERIKLQRKEVEFQQLVNVIESLKNDYDKMKIENISIKEDIQKEKGLKQREIELVQKELDSAKLKSFANEKEKIELKQEFNQLKVEISKLTSELDLQRNQQTIWKVQCDNLNRNYNDCSVEICRLKSENTFKTEEINQLKYQNSQLIIQNQGYSNQLNSSKFEITQVKQEISKLQLELNSCTCKNSRKQQNQSEWEGLLKEKVKLKNDNEKTQDVNDLSINNQTLISKEDDIKFYIDQINQLNAQISELHNSKANLQKQYGELENQNTSLLTQNNILKSQQIAMTQEITLMKTSNASFIVQQTKAQTDQDILGKKQEENTENIQKQLQKQNEKCKILEKQCLILSQNATALSDKVLQLREKNKTLEDKILENGNIPIEVGQRITSLLNEIAFLQDKLEKSKTNEGTTKKTIEQFNQINNSSTLIDQSDQNSYQKQFLDNPIISNYSDTKQSFQQISDFLSAPIKPMHSQ